MPPVSQRRSLHSSLESSSYLHLAACIGRLTCSLHPSVESIEHTLSRPRTADLPPSKPETVHSLSECEFSSLRPGLETSSSPSHPGASLKPLDPGTASEYLKLRLPLTAELPLPKLGVVNFPISQPRAADLPLFHLGVAERSPPQPRAAELPPSQYLTAYHPTLHPGATKLSPSHHGSAELPPSQH